ncbi:MAG: glycosyltransferase family 2 protein [Chitinophagales bacterium]|nr:glycosyltransferase family 2 protein [Chitinophagales bacterium]MDW8393570.1 glycosyltransferase family 2 protein [Chitinophagales bacterium]
MKSAEGKVYVVLVNFNGHLNTIETMESLAKQTYRNFQVVVVDNNTPQSLHLIRQWAAGAWTPEFTPPDAIRHLTYPLCAKPVAYADYEVAEAEQGGRPEQDQQQQQTGAFLYPLLFVQARSDIGFAGGNNVGSRLALARGDAAFVWLLNNDTTLEPDALQQLMEKDRQYRSSGRRVGIIGSKLRWYRWPDKINAIGGKFNKWTTWSYHLGLNEPDKGQYDHDGVAFDYVYGASLFVRTEFLNEVGLMNEAYYAYFEEMDWEVRGKRKGWEHGYAWQSVIYHKQGVTTGKEIKARRRPLFFMCCKYRGWLLFYWYYYPYLIFAPVLRLLLKAVKNVAEGNVQESVLILKILAGKRTCTRDMS